MLWILLVICCFDLSNTRPADESTNSSLNIVENDKNVLSSTLEQGKELLGRIADATKVNSIVLVRNVIADQAEQLSNKVSSNLATIIITPDKPNPSRRLVQTTTPIVLFPTVQQETVRLENDTAQAILERPKPDNVQQLLDSFFNLMPIVDNIKEKEKYGNTGDNFIGFSRTIINAYENLSNFLNTLIDLSVNTIKQTSREITEKLNQLGRRLIGLQ